MKQHLCVTLMALSALVAGCMSKPKPVDVNPYKPVPAFSFATSYSTNIGLNRKLASSMYVFDKLVIVYDDDADAPSAHVVDRQTGELIAIDALPTQSGTIHAPSVVGDMIVFPATTRVKVYSAKSDLKLYDFNVKFAMRTPAVGTGTTIFMGADHANGGRLEALDITKSPIIPRWEGFTGASIRSAPAMSKDLIFFASEDGIVRARSEDRGGGWSLEGTPDGSFKAGAPVIADLKADDNTVYVPSMDTKLYALNGHSGIIRWQYFGGSPLQHSPTITNDSLYMMVDGRGLVAISKAIEGPYNRKAKWSDATAVKFLADDDKYSYVLHVSNHIIALDKATGDQKFVSERSDLRLFGTNSKDAMIYAIDPQGRLLQIKPVVREGFVGELVMNDASDSLAQ